MSHCLCVCSLDDVHQVEWAWLDPGGHGEHQAQRWYVRSQSVIVFILAFIILHFDNVICLVLNYYIEVSVNAFSDTEHMYFPNVFFFQFGTFSWCIITMFSTVLMHSVCVCFQFLRTVLYILPHFIFLFYLFLPTAHCLTSNALKGKLLPSLCTIIPIILPVLTHSLWKVAQLHLLGLPCIVCLYRKSLRPTEHIFMHFDVVSIFQFYLKWGGHNGDGTGTAKQVVSLVTT